MLYFKACLVLEQAAVNFKRLIIGYGILECKVREGGHRPGPLHPELPHHSGQCHGTARHQDGEEATDGKRRISSSTVGIGPTRRRGGHRR